MRSLRIVFFIASVYGQSDVYWGSYELNIPGGSGSGNAVQDLKLPENAPEFFQFAAFNSQPFAAPQFTPVAQPAPQPAPQPAQLAILRPAPQIRPVPQPAPQIIPAPQPAPQIRPAPQPQQLRVIQTRPANRQQQRQRPAQIRQPAPQSSPVQQQAVEAEKPTQRFQNFAARSEVRRPSPVVQTQPSVIDNEVETENSREETNVDVSNLSRFQLYELRQKLKLQKESQKIEDSALSEVTTVKSAYLQETTDPSTEIVPKRKRTGVRRKAVRRKLVRSNA